jgi:site-specific recombinase XerD
MTAVAAWRHNRYATLSLRASVSPHSSRACVTTDMLSQNVALEDIQYLLGHSDSRVTKLYDRSQRQLTRNIGWAGYFLENQPSW